MSTISTESSAQTVGSVEVRLRHVMDVGGVTLGRFEIGSLDWLIRQLEKFTVYDEDGAIFSNSLGTAECMFRLDSDSVYFEVVLRTEQA